MVGGGGGEGGKEEGGRGKRGRGKEKGEGGREMGGGGGGEVVRGQMIPTWKTTFLASKVYLLPFPCKMESTTSLCNKPKLMVISIDEYCKSHNKVNMQPRFQPCLTYM